MKRNLLLLCSFLVLGLLTSGLPAFGQGVQFASAGGLRNVRVEGHTEVVNEVTLRATNAGTVTGGTTLNFAYSATITNAPVLANCSFNGGACVAPFALTVSGNTLTIKVGTVPGVDDKVFAINDSITISGIRVDVAGAGAIAQVVCDLSSFSSAPTTNPVTYYPTSVQVATVISPSTKVKITETDMGVLTCNPPTHAADLLYSFAIEVKENAVGVFSTLDQEKLYASTPTVPTDPTNVLVNISGVPSGLTVSFDGYDATQSATLASTTAAGTKTSTGKTLTWTFPVTASASAQVEKFVLNFSVFKKSTDTLGLGSATVTATVQLGPIDDVDPDAPSGTPSLLFAENEQGSGTVFGVSDCVTNLLFPWVVYEPTYGYDTGIALANTTKDPFVVGGAKAQTGSCVLNGYPTTPSTLGSGPVAVAAIAYTTPSVPSGATWANSLSNIAAFNAADFTGYVIAVCQFQNAHGFAFISDNLGADNGITQGYVALIIPTPALTPRSPAGGGAGEGLNE